MYLPAQEIQIDALSPDWQLHLSNLPQHTDILLKRTEICGGDSCFQQALDKIIDVISDQMVGDPVKSTAAAPKFPVSENEWELCTWVSLCALERSL